VNLRNRARDDDILVNGELIIWNCDLVACTVSEVNCCWPSPAQSFLIPSPAGLMTKFYSFMTLSTSKIFYHRRSIGQSVLVSGRTWGSRSDFYYCQKVAGLLKWSALFDERTGLSFTIAAGSHQRSHSRGPSPA
jgi:hypothetical protein